MLHLRRSLSIITAVGAMIPLHIILVSLSLLLSQYLLLFLCGVALSEHCRLFLRSHWLHGLLCGLFIFYKKRSRHFLLRIALYGPQQTRIVLNCDLKEDGLGLGAVLSLFEVSTFFIQSLDPESNPQKSKSESPSTRTSPHRLISIL